MESQEVRQKILELLKEIDQLCRNNNVEYYLTGGTLLGALRHKGFIPWDDDADIIMTRDNWEKFLNTTKGKLPDNIALNTQYEDANLALTINRYVDTKTTSIYRFNLTDSGDTGIEVDIVIMDPIPDDSSAKEKYVSALMTHTDLTVLPYQYSLRLGKSTHFRWYWLLSRIIGKRATLNLIDKDSFSYDDKTSELYVQRFAGSPHFWPKEFYGKPHYVPFEDTMLPIPQRAYDCLCVGFDDDWMYVPANGQLKSTHDFCIRSLTIPGKVITNDFRKMVNHKKVIHTYVKKKEIQVDNTQKKMYQELGKDKFVEAKLQMIYARKRKEENFQEYLCQKNYTALETYFKEYIDEQCTSRYLGSSALSGWINWYRKCNPFLIDIGDEELYAVLVLLFHQQHLAWIGKLLKARDALDRPLTEQLEDIKQEYDAVKAAKSHFYCEEWNECCQILDEFYPKYPDNPFLIQISIEIKLKLGSKFGDVAEELGHALELFPDDSILLLLKAESNFEVGGNKNALSIYWYLSGNTRNGLVLRRMKEKIEELLYTDPNSKFLSDLYLAVRQRSGEEIEEISEENVCEDDGNGQCDIETNVNDVLNIASNDVQEIRYKLLVEVSQLCDKYDIQYYLINKALWMAERSEENADPYANFSVAMFPDDCMKFMQAVEKENNPDRYIDSMYTNPYFNRLALYYCDRNTLDMGVYRCDCGDRFGIYVSIEILRHPAKNKYLNALYRGLETGWELSFRGKWSSYKQLLCKEFEKFLNVVLFGRKRSSKIIFKWLLREPKNKNEKTVFLKPYDKNRKYYPSNCFAESKEIQFKGHTFTTMKLSGNFLKIQYGKKWRKKIITQTNYNPTNRIISSQIPYQDYLDYLEENHISRKAYGKNYRNCESRYSRVAKCNEEIDRYWDIMCLCGDRYRLYEKYMPLKTQIMELYNSGNIEELKSVLYDYSHTAIHYAKRELNVSFDQDISNMSEYTLEKRGKTKEAQMIHDIIQKYPMPPINTNFMEEE